MDFDWIKGRSIANPDKVAVIDAGKKTQWTYRELNIRAENLANHLQEQGIKKGDRVGAFVPNDIAVIDLFLASIKLGAVFVPLNWRLKAVEIARIVEDAGIEYILYATNHYDRLADVPQEYIKYNVDEAEYNAIVDPSSHRPFKSVDLQPDDVAMLIYTSGSTGTPKGVIHTHHSYRNNTFNEIMSWDFHQSSSTIIFAPIFHVVAFNDLAVTILMVGGTLILERYFEPKTIVDRIATYKPSILVLIPTMYYALLANKEFHPSILEPVEYCISGGSPPLPEITQAFNQFGVQILNVYGMTEAPLCTYNPPELAKKHPNGIGRAIANVEFKVVNEAMEEVLYGQIGELLIRGENVTPGYWNLPELNETEFYQGFYKSGDLATMTEDGVITIINRKKELIITGGENVLPSEVEVVLNKHPLIKTAIVIGYDNPVFGESVSAAVILNKEALHHDDYEKVLDEYCLKNLAGYKTPKLYLVLDQLPVNSTGKPDRLVLREMMNAYAKEKEKEKSVSA
ncbi:long-chain acyl-CoA synthetase [Ignavigranum ruoffiae]|uniref:Long-chain acyl-CoA synthetase n=1 Tax=Ignavigranum ruoffiae TaxID=89093 RepID=A0A1H9D9N3_9LACT|nr:class I adenylate-forming enzyme family protein [Ignavigranum ruoffiae]SEQ10037.1 long-chain acyl-CoA synthetase [Ignavigranum ruoffiae]